ncbi:MAG: hypothetical protein M3537_09490, partial [Chloroflexota bacterium]|nr:hypothetical protein [Chloroflexota bacterium]
DLSWRRAAHAPGIQGKQGGQHGILHLVPHRAEGFAGLFGMSLLTAPSAVILSAAKDLSSGIGNG